MAGEQSNSNSEDGDSPPDDYPGEGVEGTDKQQCDTILAEQLNALHKAVTKSRTVTKDDLTRRVKRGRRRRLQSSQSAVSDDVGEEDPLNVQRIRRDASSRIALSSLVPILRVPRNNIDHNNNNHLNNALSNFSLNRISFLFGLFILLIIFVATPVINNVFEHVLSIRCFMPNNYLIWEATRPVSDCSFCQGIDEPLILPNMTKEEFQPYAFSSRPIIIKNAVSHWPAASLLNYTFLKDLYIRTPGAVREECQFLHFKSNFMSLGHVFEMSEARAQLKQGEIPWYVGWSNCHPVVLAELRKLYPRPHFLPDDAEMPNTDFIFLGFEQGAVMHLDYIPRLMWQAQLKGRKKWLLAPTPECEAKCKSFGFIVDPGDAVLVDTRLWYHGTWIVSQGEFSLTIQSEYG